MNTVLQLWLWITFSQETSSFSFITLSRILNKNFSKCSGRNADYICPKIICLLNILCCQQGCLSSRNTLEQVPPSPPLPVPSPLPSPSPPLLYPPLRSRPPLLRLGGLGERFRSPAGPGGAWLPNGI